MIRKQYIGLLIAASMLFCLGCAPKKVEVIPTDGGEISGTSLAAVKAYEEGKKAKSLELYQALVATEPKNPVYLNNMGVVLLEGGQAKEALDAFESASLLDPENADYLANIGFAQIKLSDLDEAQTFFDRALLLDSSSSLGYYGKGIVYLYLNEPEIALGLFRRASVIDETNSDVLFMRAYAAQKSELWTEAIQDYTAYIGWGDHQQQRANAFSNRALCFFQLKDFESGMKDLGEAIALNDNSSVYYYNRAQGFQMKHEYEEAVKDYTRAISRKASFPEAYINRGELNTLLDKQAKGCADLQRACELGYCEQIEKYKSAGKCAD